MASVEAVRIPSRFGEVWQRRRILWLLVTRDLKVKYAGSALGYVWSVLDPLMMAGVYWFVFTQLMHRRLGEAPYIVFLLAAMLPFQWATGTIRTSMRALGKDAKLVRSVGLPREIWVLRTVASKFMEFLFSLPVLAFFALITGAHLTWYVVFFPLAVLLQGTLLLGLSLVLAPLALLYSDVQRLVKVVLRLLFYFSPILYGLHDIKHRLGPAYAHLFVLNPFAGILGLYRTAFFADQWSGWSAVAVAAVESAIFLVLGLWVFRRLEGQVLKEI